MSLSRYAIAGCFLIGCEPNWYVIDVDPETAARGQRAMDLAMEHWEASVGRRLEAPAHTFGWSPHDWSALHKDRPDFIVFFPEWLDGDIQWLNAALHELGHHWGLGHTHCGLMSERVTYTDCVDWAAAHAYLVRHGEAASPTCPTTDTPDVASGQCPEPPLE